MNKDLIDFYKEQKQKIERNIEELWEVGKKSKSKEKRLFEIDLILTGLYANVEIDSLKQKVRDYKKRLESEGIIIDE